MPETRRGFLLGAAAYGMWGLFPLYWPLLDPAGAVEILAHRIVWSLLVMAALVLVLRRGRRLRWLLSSPRRLTLLTIASVVIGLNWGMFIWGVNNERVVEVSLGYFINPLVTVLIGVVVLKERLRTPQWVALGIAAVAVIGLTVEYGRLPWVAIVLAFSFGTYGLMKKKADSGAVESLTFETAVLTPVALGYLAWLTLQGGSHAGSEGALHLALLAGTGVVTAIPLICFGAAATRISLTTIGLLQYMTPSLQFAIGVFLYGEPMPPTRLAGFLLVWVALAVFTVDAVRNRRRQLRRAAEAAAV